MSSLKDRGSLVSTAVDNTSLWVRGHNWQAIYGKTSRAVFTTDSARKEPKMEFGLYTFADVGPRIDPARRLHNLLEEIELADELGLDVFVAGRSFGSRGSPHEEHSPDERGHGSELRRPRARLPRLRHARSHLGRSRGDHGWPRLVHRVVPAVRLRLGRLRRPVLRETRVASEAARVRARHVVGQAPRAAR